MEDGLTARVAIVTGAGSGIGRATVLTLLARGTRVLATDIDPEALDQLGEATGFGVDLLQTVVGNIALRAEADMIVGQAVEHFGRLDILVNSAGITARNAHSEDFEDKWDAVMAVNAKGTLLMCHAAVEAMRQSGGGSIVNIASVMGVVGYPTQLPFSDGFNAYTHSKGAVIQLTRDMGVRLAGEGIRVNVVCPGFVYTPLTANVTGDPAIHRTICDLHPMGRMGTAQEIANVIAFLASEDASFVTGAVWAVDGGYTAQ